MTRRRFLRQGAAVAAALGIPGLRAQPAAVRIVTPFAAGGGSDSLARVLAEQMHKLSGQTYIVDPRPGANGKLANNAILSAKPDGNTLMLQVGQSFTVIPHTSKDPKDQVFTSIEPVAALNRLDSVLYVSDSVPAATFPEFVELLRKEDKYRFCGLTGLGGVSHFFTVMLGNSIKVPLQIVPYQGGNPLLLALMGGQVPLAVSVILSATVQARNEKRIRMLGTTGPKRSSFLPDVPTMTEAGYPETAISDWSGIFAPPGTPAPLVNSIYSLINEATRQPQYLESMNKLMLEPMSASPAECSALLRKDYAIWQPIVRASGFKES